MDNYPILITDDIDDIALVLRRILAIRKDDIAEIGTLSSIASYESGFRRNTVSTSASYSVGLNDLAVAGTGGAGGITLTLDASPVDGQTHEFWKADSGAGAVTIDGNGNNINGSGTLALSSQYAWARVIYFGSSGLWLLQQ